MIEILIHYTWYQTWEESPNNGLPVSSKARTTRKIFSCSWISHFISLSVDSLFPYSSTLALIQNETIIWKSLQFVKKNSDVFLAPCDSRFISWCNPLLSFKREEWLVRMQDRWLRHGEQVCLFSLKVGLLLSFLHSYSPVCSLEFSLANLLMSLILLQGTLNILEEENHIKDVLSRIVVEMIKREWPQHWPDMLVELDTLSKQGVCSTAVSIQGFVFVCSSKFFWFVCLPCQQKRAFGHIYNAKHVFT